MVDGQHKNLTFKGVKRMTDKTNPWLSEADRVESGSSSGKKFEDVRDMKFQDNKEYQIRCIPHPDSKQFPFVGYISHWVPQANSKNNRPIVHAIDKRCIICDWISDQWKEINRMKEEDDMTDKSPEVIKIRDKMKPVNGKKRYDMNILDRHDMTVENKETKQKTIAPKRMSAPFNVYESIFSCAKKYGSPSDAITGYDFTITTEGEGERRQYSTLPERENSPLTVEEIESVKRGFDVQRLRKPSTVQEMYSILENAKAPFNDILDYLSADEKLAGKEHSEKQKNDVKNIEKQSSPSVEEKVERAEPIEPKKNLSIEEPVKTTAVASSVMSNDEGDLNQYECKGSYDANDVGCENSSDPCPVNEQCKKAAPYYKKAAELGIDVSQDKPFEKVIEEVEEKTKVASVDTTKRRRRVVEDVAAPAPVVETVATAPAKKKLPF